MIAWRPKGLERMGTVDLRKLGNDQIVVHFGGQLTSVDAYTFANSLISFADTVRSVNEMVNPGQKIDVRLEAVGPGSFKAVIKQVKKGLSGFFSSAPSNVFWIVAALLIEGALEGESTITVEDDVVIIERGGERIILPREAFNGYKNAKNSPQVRRGIGQTIEVLEKDEAIENFGITPDLNDDEPLIQIPRDNFDRLTKLPDTVLPEEKRRLRSNRAQLVVLKPWINASNKKWAFEWNGVPISAYVKDENFLERVKNHDIRFGNGDVIEATIENYENFDDKRNIWISDKSTYMVTEVFVFHPINAKRIVLK